PRPRHRGMAARAHAAPAIGSLLHRSAGLGLRSCLAVERSPRPHAQDADLRARRRAVSLARRAARTNARGLSARRWTLDGRDRARRQRARGHLTLRGDGDRHAALVDGRASPLTVYCTIHARWISATWSTI